MKKTFLYSAILLSLSLSFNACVTEPKKVTTKALINIGTIINEPITVDLPTKQQTQVVTRQLKIRIKA